MIFDKIKCLLGFHKWDWIYEATDSCKQVVACSRCNTTKGNDSRLEHKWGNWEYSSLGSCLNIQICLRCGENQMGGKKHGRLERKWDLSEKIFIKVCERCHDKVIDPEGNRLLAELMNTSESAARALVMIGLPSVEPLLEALQNERERIRQLAAWALGNIGDTKSINPLTMILRKDKSVWVRLASYKALQQLLGHNISESDTKELIESVATEIRRLYSIIVDHTEWVTEVKVVRKQGDIGALRRKYGSYYPDDEAEWDEEEKITRSVTEKRAAPDLDSVRRLIAETPASLRDQVQALSGMSKDSFQS